MPYPLLLHMPSPSEYQKYFDKKYCQGLITTFDGLGVRFRKKAFSHCFYESTHRDQVKDSFSSQRAERIDWIEAALKDSSADLFQGWDKARKRYDKTHRVAVVEGNYIVVIRLTGPKSAEFVTAYVADTPSTVARIMSGPRW